MGSAMHHVHHGQDAEYGNDCGHVRERPEEMQVEGVDTQGWATLSDEGNWLPSIFCLTSSGTLSRE
jgi:hypothetical protein